MNLRIKRLTSLDSDHRLQILQQLRTTQCRLRLVDLQHGVGSSDHRE